MNGPLSATIFFPYNVLCHHPLLLLTWEFRWIKCAPSLHCPCCYHLSLNSTSINTQSPLLTSLVDDLLINCKRNWYLQFNTSLTLVPTASIIITHYKETDSPEVTIKDVLAKPHSSPTTTEEMRATGQLVRRIIQKNALTENPTVVKVPKGFLLKKSIRNF